MFQQVRAFPKLTLPPVVAIMLAGAVLHAQQQTASIRGTVTDPSGARVVGAQVSAIQIETALTRQVETDNQGDYLLVLLPIGHYRLEATAPGFQKYIQTMPEKPNKIRRRDILKTAAVGAPTVAERFLANSAPPIQISPGWREGSTP
jgi:hypothetical protein